MVSCKKIARNLSAYIEDDVDRKLCGEIERHLAHCRRCSVLLDSVRKVIVICGDEQTFDLPLGYGSRLQSFLERHI